MVDRINMIEVIASIRVNERAGAAPSGEQYAAERASLQNSSDEELQDTFNRIRQADAMPPATDNDIEWTGMDGTDDEPARISFKYDELHR